MTDGRPAEVWANARAERQATVGWAPDDWDVVLRRQRRSDRAKVARRRLRWAHRWPANPVPWTEEARWT